MKIQTFTIVTGTAACNAKCPYCISKMTGIKEIGFKKPKINWRNFNKACKIAQINNVSTALFTGKGEPTLYPDQITEFLENMKKFDFPLIEIQTNGLNFGRNFEKYKKYLKKWYDLGLNTIAFSIAHYDKEKNKQIFTPNSEYINLEKLIKQLHELGYSIRLSVIMLKGFIDSPKEVKKMVDFSKTNKVEQLTIRSVKAIKSSENKAVHSWTIKRILSKKQLQNIFNYLKKNADKIMTLDHGGIVYDFQDQNICLTDCLTIKSNTEDLRQLIFFPDGHLRYDWQYKGAILM